MNVELRRVGRFIFVHQDRRAGNAPGILVMLRLVIASVVPLGVALNFASVVEAVGIEDLDLARRHTGAGGGLGIALRIFYSTG